jgi:putative membrane protein
MQETGTTSITTPQTSSQTFDAYALTRPAPVLMTYYAIIAVLSNVAILVTMPVLYFRYHTLRFKFDEDGIHLAWGILYRREIQLTYRRIQDIHVTRNIIQRWLGLASVAIQTASGSAGAEMIIEGVLQADELRDFLYRKMRGARGDEETTHTTEGSTDDATDQALVLLRQIRDEIHEIAKARRDDAGAST